ncbi:SOS response-associated peptidase [Sulfitobacter sp. D35]|uniref:SOS response-associated peptidase n=1 Tax=Sulfitobacter sp. D35 TaxID=3083252 RepID=UPI00296FF053|nr:SOS response-associated peptidase [Sulfitobacter sp. D35]MDW4498703.1 SOS response-associated peptidase [Sulfitobacter sp. D35]
MCGRFAITLPPDAMAQLFEAAPANDLPHVPNYNVCPTNRIHIVTGGDDADRRLVAMRWGLIPHWYKKENDGPLLINARSETVAEKPAFRSAVRSRRALAVTSGFYEWTKAEDGGKDPWFITRRDGAPLVIAAIWQNWGPKDGETRATAALVTTAANETMGRIHHRMPVLLEPGDWPLWLGEAGHGAAELMRPASEDVLQMHRVGRAVNSNRATGPELVAPFDED